MELAPVCEKCGGLPDGVLNLQTEAGLSLTGDADVLITGHSIISGKPVRIKLTDYGFEYYGDHAELARVREKRCVYVRENCTAKRGSNQGAARNRQTTPRMDRHETIVTGRWV